MSELSPSDSALATQVLQTFMDAAKNNDEATMLTCVTRKTIESGQMHASGGPDGRAILDNQRMEGEVLVIHGRMFAADTPADAAPVMEMDCLMVKEDGQWKFDLPASVDRMMGGEGALEKVVEGLASAMGEAMKGVGEAMAEGFKQAFGPGDAPAALSADQDWSTASLAYTGKELLPVPMPWKNLPKTQAAIKEALGYRVLVNADMKTINERIHNEEEPDPIFAWFEDSLFAGWPAMLANIAPSVPLEGRLRAIRIESASSTEHRMLAVDGSDLVYRMMLPQNEGFYQDDEIAAMLPGVLAGLPETIDSTVAGFRLLPWDDESVDLELYRQTVAPRYMRRISELVDHHVALDVDWDDLAEVTDSGRMLSLWGLNRVYGGIAFACLDPAQRWAMNHGLTRVRIVLTCEVAKGEARYADGVLDFRMKRYGGSDAGLYEHEIAQALQGFVPEAEAKSEEPQEAQPKPKRKRSRKKGA